MPLQRAARACRSWHRDTAIDAIGRFQMAEQFNAEKVRRSVEDVPSIDDHNEKYGFPRGHSRRCAKKDFLIAVAPPRNDTGQKAAQQQNAGNPARFWLSAGRVLPQSTNAS